MSSAATRGTRTVLTLGVLVAVVVVATVLAWRALTAPTGAGSIGVVLGAACAPAPGDPEPQTSTVELNVFNGTERNGLAARAAKDLRERGFVILQITSAGPDDFQSGVAEIRGSLTAQAEAAVVLAQFTGATFRPDNRPDATIDVFLGAKYKKLTKEGATYKPSSKTPVCTTLVSAG